MRLARLRALPDFVILGAMAAGTTSLYEYLTDHPDVWAPSRKEIQFFSYRYDRGLSYYRSHFPLRVRMRLAGWRRGVRVVTGEATPSYLFHPKAPGRLATHLPHARLIVLVRDPVDRAFSHYKMMVNQGKESLGFGQAIRAETDRLAGVRVTEHERRARVRRPRRYFSYVERGRYAEQLERYLDVFPREQILVIRSEEMFLDPGRVYERVLVFLGLRADVPFPEFLAYRRSEDPSEAPEAVRGELGELFREPNRRLLELTGIDLSKSLDERR